MLFPEALHRESLPFESSRYNTIKCRASYVTYSLKLTEFLRHVSTTPERTDLAILVPIVDSYNS
jgi:hypothetical protein